MGVAKYGAKVSSRSLSSSHLMCKSQKSHEKAFPQEMSTQKYLCRLRNFIWISDLIKQFSVMHFPKPSGLPVNCQVSLVHATYPPMTDINASFFFLKLIFLSALHQTQSWKLVPRAHTTYLSPTLQPHPPKYGKNIFE